jgi:hypothetical protein
VFILDRMPPSSCLHQPSDCQMCAVHSIALLACCTDLISHLSGMYGKEDLMIYSVPAWFVYETDSRTFTFQCMQNTIIWLLYALTYIHSSIHSTLTCVCLLICIYFSICYF